MSSARGFFFLLFTNKFVLHAGLLLIALSTITSQFTTNTAAAADVGQGSILYALIGHNQEEIVQEDVHPQSSSKIVSYLGEETIQAIPDIDFDYESDHLADVTVPGSIAQQPSLPPTETPEEDVVVQRTKTELYTVLSGDTVAVIARRFGITVGTIIEANGLSKQAAIKPGDTLKIPPVSGLLHVVKKGDTVAKLAKTYQTQEEKILSANQLSETILAVGEEIIIPDGIPVVKVAARPPSTLRPGVTPSRVNNKNYDTYQELIDTRPDTRTKPADVDTSNVPSEKMVWPTEGRVITQYYNGVHTGLDIDGDYSSSLIAAAGGKVVEAGWNSSGYGLQIVIDHLDGRKTRYAHSSKLFVKVGDTVKKGQVVGMMGTTGRSTGTHLHFEVYLNGKRKNPLTYIK